MANYEINLTATQIEAALNKAHAPATAVDTTQNLVESGAIKTYVDTQVSAGASITTASFAGSALEDSTDGLTATDTAVPTSAAVKDYVDLSRGTTTLTRSAELLTGSNYTNSVSIGNVSSGIYAFHYEYQYRNQQYNSVNTGVFNLKVGSQTLINQLTSSGANYTDWIDVGFRNLTVVPQLRVIDLTSGGGSVVLKVTRASTYGGSATMGVRNVILKFIKVSV
tara:strand:+ start:2801 stop:3469 length:669 start_codon:yes stop_codon:yes gene_type:complete